MEGSRLLQKLRLTNFLSYGPEGTEVELEPLNVLIGPNGSGKSNLIEAIGLLKAAPTDISAPIQAGGGMPEWPWKGAGSSAEIELTVQATVSNPEGKGPLKYSVQLASVGQQLRVVDESIEDAAGADYYYRYQRGKPVLRTVGPKGRSVQSVDPKHIDTTKSILSQRKDPVHYPELDYLANALSQIGLFRDCNLGRKSPLRGPQRADLTASFLLEDAKNLGMVVNDLLNRPPTKRRLVAELKRFSEQVEDITTKIVAGTVETSFHERGFRDSTPSMRLSDGTLRCLFLLTILCHPAPPPLVCIEDPEVALHPDVLPRLADLLVEASEKTQLVVTTHSDVLVSALSHVPEAVIVCERDDDGSHLTRLDADRLEHWLKKYTLGELWMSGEIGGTS
jgi:predicted ATPase